LAGVSVGSIDGDAEVVIVASVEPALREYLQAGAVAVLDTLPAGGNVGFFDVLDGNLRGHLFVH